MSFETQKIITLLNKFLDEHGDEYQNDEEAIAAFQMQYNQSLLMGEGFIDDSDEDLLWDLLEELYYTRPGTPKRRKVARQISEIEPENLEAKQVLFSYLPRPEELYELEKLEREEVKKLDPEEMGWEYIENRPYLRLKADLAGKYVRNTFFTKAEKQYKELLEMNPNDSLGARFELMNVYAHLEKYDEVKSFLDEYEKEYRLNDLLLVLCFDGLAKTIDLNYFAEWLLVTKKTLTKKK